MSKDTAKKIPASYLHCESADLSAEALAKAEGGGETISILYNAAWLPVIQKNFLSHAIPVVFGAGDLKEPRMLNVSPSIL